MLAVNNLFKSVVMRNIFLPGFITRIMLFSGGGA